MRAALTLVLALSPHLALAHDGAAHPTPSWAGLDHLEVTLPLVALALIYAAGLARLARNRRLNPGERVRALLFVAGWLAIALTLLTPLHRTGAVLFTAHMIEHEVLMVAAAPLLVASRPAAVLIRGVPALLRAPFGRTAGAFGRALSGPGAVAAATLAHGAAIWLWHVPALYAAALGSVAVHWLQHASFVATALWFWSALLDRRAAAPGPFAALFATMMHTGLLGVLLALSPRVIFPGQSAGAGEFGLTAVEDQQLAGLVMWVPTGLVYAAAGLALAARWLRPPREGGRIAAR